MVPCFPLLGLAPSGLFMGLSSTLIYTSELILCPTIKFNTNDVEKLLLSAEPNHCDRNQIRNQNDLMN